MRVVHWLQSAVAAASLTGAASAQVLASAEGLEPTPVQVGEPVAATGPITEAAATYATFQTKVSDVQEAPLSGPEHLEDTLTEFGGQHPQRLSEGWISYSALVAAQSEEFAAAVRDIDAFYGRDRVTLGLRNDVGYARTLEGGDDALQAALSANASDSRRISSAAAFVKDQARTLQHAPWANKRIHDGSQRAEKLQLAAQTGQPMATAALSLFSTADIENALINAGRPGASSLWDSVAMLAAEAPMATVASFTPSFGAKTYEVNPKRKATADRIVTLAAYHVLDAAADNPTEVKVAMQDRPTSQCIDWSQMQLRACVSAASSRYDLSYCLSEHAIADTGACFGDVAH